MAKRKSAAHNSIESSNELPISEKDKSAPHSDVRNTHSDAHNACDMPLGSKHGSPVGSKRDTPQGSKHDSPQGSKRNTPHDSKRDTQRSNKRSMSPGNKRSMPLSSTRVDVVITWVDGSDPAWQEQKNAHLPQNYRVHETQSHEIRFRDWDNLQYIFRGIENFMPWVDKVFLVTWGHLPPWLNTNCKKLCVVRHEDFIPAEYLPTFNSNTIEMNLHRIPDLAEHFILFNDDMFVLGPTRKRDFFKRGIPRSSAALSPYPVYPGGIACTEMNNLEIINAHFTPASIRNHSTKWINPRYGTKALRTIMFMRAPCVFGILEPHTPLSLCKQTLRTLWELEPEVLDNTCQHKFRSKEDVNIWLARHWQLMEGNFAPRATSFERNASLPRDFELANDLIAHPGKCRLICINDSVNLDNFEATRDTINESLDGLLPQKSSFEL